MKAITLTQPWASLVALGEKRIETRSWSTSYRGPIAIHAAKGFPRAAVETCFEEPFDSVLRPHFPLPLDLPRGAIVATAYLAGVAPTDHPLLWAAVVTTGAPHERAFGNYDVGRYAWVLADIRALPTPIPARGALGLWEWGEAEPEESACV